MRPCEQISQRIFADELTIESDRFVGLSFSDRIRNLMELYGERERVCDTNDSGSNFKYISVRVCLCVKTLKAISQFLKWVKNLVGKIN